MIVVVMAVMFMKVIVSIYCIHWLGGIIRCGYGCVCCDVCAGDDNVICL